MAKDDPEREKQAIIDVIEGEFAAFFARDFAGYAAYWLHTEDCLRLVTLAGGQIACIQGWEAESAMVKRIFRHNPRPNSRDVALMRRENMRIRVSDTMAWASFDQIGPVSDDPLMDFGLSHHVRILEKHEGRWKIVYVGHADPAIESYTCPTVRVDEAAVIVWMNEAARAQLDDHPVLVKDRGHLMARTRADTRLLRDALALIADLTPLDVRSPATPTDVRLGAVPVMLGESHADKAHLIWVMYQDQMLLVSFNDPDREQQRLAVARAIYGLSEAQFRLAGMIVEGQDIVKAAEQIGISVTTARTHLQRMFDKTGVRSQTALVRLLLSAVAPTS